MELFEGEEDLHGPGAEPAHQQKNHHPPHKGPQQAPEGALQRAEGVSGGDLQRLAGDDGHHDLENHHPHKEEGGPDALAVHPLAKQLRLPGELYQGAAGEPADEQGEKQKEGDANTGDPPFLYLCQWPMLTHKGNSFPVWCLYCTRFSLKLKEGKSIRFV